MLTGESFLASFDQTPIIILRLIHLPPRILYAVGLPSAPDRKVLEQYAANRTLVVISPGLHSIG
jgi:hypothetical protein